MIVSGRASAATRFSLAQPGNLIQPLRRRQRGSVSGPSGLRPGDAVRVHALGAGNRGQVSGNPLLQLPQLGLQEVDSA